MKSFILGEKSEQSQIFNDKGERIPTTFINTTTCYVVDLKTPEKHGYFSVKLGFGKIKNIKKPQKVELAKAGIKTPLRFLREFRLEKNNLDEMGLKIGDELKPTALFQKGDLVKISGLSKGKGFAGVVKRHSFAGGPKTHGQSDRHRGPGSIGASTTPGRVLKGMRMAGRMGGGRVTVSNLQIVDVQENGIVVKGLVPGPKKGLLEIRSQI